MFEMPRIPEMKPIKFVSLSADDIKSMSTDKLKGVLSGETDVEGDCLTLPTITAINNELSARNMQAAAKPHWSIVPTFILATIGTVAACIAAYPVLFPNPTVTPSRVEVVAQAVPSLPPAAQASQAVKPAPAAPAAVANSQQPPQHSAQSQSTPLPK